MLALEQCAYLRAQGVTIATVCEAIGLRGVHGWDRLAWALAAKLREARSIIVSGERVAA